MSTQQILGVVGGVVGAFFGYPQLGFVVGSLVGGLLTPGEKTEGPRVDDLKVQVSTYGAGIPIVYGAERVGGNVVWSTDKIEMEETTGGKGGAPEQTTYRYFVHMGIVLCETPRDGSEVSIVQIFQDGKLIYDARSGIPVGSALASEENPHAYFVLYQGHADQLPDPGEEAWMGGPGSVPAYCGVVRIRMNAVECPGGRVPQFSFVIATNASVITEMSEYARAPADSQYSWASITAGGSFQFDRRNNPIAPSNQLFSVGNEYARALPPVDYSSPPWASPEAVQADSVPSAVIWRHQDQEQIIQFFGVDGLIASFTREVETLGDVINIGKAAHDSVSSKFCVVGAGSREIHVLPAGPSIVTDSIQRPSIAFYSDTIYAIARRGGSVFVDSFSAVDGEFLESLDGGNLVSSDEQASYLLVSASSRGVFVLDAHQTGPATPKRVWRVSGQWTLLTSHAAFDNEDGSVRTFSANDSSALVGPSSMFDGYVVYTLVRYGALQLNGASVAGILSEQCERSGVDATKFDVSEMDGTVHGYKLQNPASARANIDPLLTAFSAYIVDEDNVIKFKKYEDITSVAAISYDELGQAEAGAEPADAMPLNRAQEVDLPRSVSVSYIDPLHDYQTASEKEIRQITDANEDMIVELPLATTSDHAKRVAQTILFNRWRAQNTRSCKVSRKYTFASSGDGITVEYPRGNWRLWRITSMTDTGALCEFNVEPGDSELYTQNAIGATGYEGQQVAPLAPQTLLQLLDIPILRDIDNNAGIYAAFDSYADAPANAELFVGDDDASLSPRGTVSASAPIGFAETVLPGWTRNLIDETNIFTVNLGAEVFNSVSRDVLLANGGEIWALGDLGVGKLAARPLVPVWARDA